jgi:hypothetical protein
MNKLNFYRQPGFRLPELVEKEKGKVVAQMRCSANRFCKSLVGLSKKTLDTTKKILGTTKH